MSRINSILFIFILFNFFFATPIQAVEQNCYSRIVNKSKPLPRQIIVSVYQSSEQSDFFTRINNKIAMKNNREVSIQLQNYGIKTVRKFVHTNEYATYLMTFSEEGKEADIIRYLESLPDIRYAEQNYSVELLVEPNDYYYNNDFWVPDTLYGRWCKYPEWSCCTEDSSEVEERYFPETWYVDETHATDQWYLEHVQANKAWDITKGDTVVKVMVMDSGIDIDHPDLNDNIWRNTADPIGDSSNDGVPGTADKDIDNDGFRGFNDFQVRTKDFDGDGIALWGSDSLCDAGPDGDYGFGPNAVDDSTWGPGGGDDDTVVVGGYDAWDDNLRGPGSLNPDSSFNDDMDEVVFLKNDDDENGYPDDYYGFNFVDPYSLPLEDSCPIYPGCHGTPMAGIIGAVTDNSIGCAGFTWNCRLVAAKINYGTPENEADSGRVRGIDLIAEALMYAADNEIDIVNMSIGIPDTVGAPTNWNCLTIEDAVDYAYERGVIMIAGAGNENKPIYYYPASFSSDKVMSVSGTHMLDEKAVKACWNDRVDVCAPISDPFTYGAGTNAVVTSYSKYPLPQFEFFPGQDLPHDYSPGGGGTSSATALVSGLACLLVSIYPKSLVEDLYPAQYSPEFYIEFIRDEIERGCESISGAHADSLGAGRINAYRSLTQWGTISTNTTWSNVVYVSGDIVVDTSATLTIDPGTEIYFATEDNDNIYDASVIEFVVMGNLVAEGTSANPIEFKSLAGTPQKGDWFGVLFYQYKASGSLSYCNISHAYTGVRSDVDIEMSHCNITDCDVFGIYVRGATLGSANGTEISYCKVNDNDLTGIFFENCDSIGIHDCEANNNYYGVKIDTCDYVTIDTMNVKFNDYDGIKAIASDYYDFDWCYADSNGQHGMYLYNASSGYITKSRMKGNDGNGMLCTGNVTNPFIDHSKIEDNGAAGLRANSSAFPVLGNEYWDIGKDNSIMDDVPRVYNNTSDTLDAEKCYWGTSSPNMFLFTGIVDFNPYRTTDAVTYLAPAINNKTIFSLSQNYPNPFISGKTTINYSIPKASERVSLKVYDVSGRRVRTLVDKTQAAGLYKVKWDGRNDRGSNVAPGVYFYQLKLGDRKLSKRIVLLR